jgi:pyruvate formate lyase activating enzyme
VLIGGLQKTTLIDYPDKIAATIFTIGCNFRCSFCHNPNIVKGIARVLPADKVFDFLKSRKGLLDAVCITGGEPTIQSGLIQFIRELKKLGLLVKIDTNGTNPTLLEKVIDQKLVDYVAMDIKSAWADYPKITCRLYDLTDIQKSATMLMENKVPYEFRSTVMPLLHSEEEIIEMARQIKGAEKYFLQPFKSEKKLVNDNLVSEATYSKKALSEIVEKIKGWFTVCRVR